FSSWPESALRALRTGARLRSAPPGSTVILQTYPVHGVYSIVEGSIEVGSTQAAGRRFIRRFAKPGTLFGLVSVLDGQGSPYTYLAHTKVLLLYVERTALLAALSKDPPLWRDIA